MSQPDPLQEQDIQDRTEKYQQWLQHYEANLPVSSTANVQPVVDLTSVVTAIRAHPTITSAQREQIDELADRVQQAMRKIEVQPVGDIVIQLTMPESMSIASY
ncbi:hypothetical protein DM01DRAFT_1340114 [Hesseltinella vesiculosa]|uniref:Uncharacterized protein n=1 Tax=Hesseltinella vesiculosa TaxID=101127 RepID=A0A1X2G534_9FUNG|nr:hypothetical protein DM01DRAFT_1340114 [Hesseltinella vesiculosa]